MTRFIIQQCASEACSGGNIYQNYSWDYSKQKDYFEQEKNTMIFCNLYSKVTLLSIRECFDVHILQQGRAKRNREVVLLNQQKHKFCIIIKSQYLTIIKAVHNEYHHIVRKTEYNVQRLREAYPHLAKMSILMLSKMHNFSKLEEIWPQCIQHVQLSSVLFKLLWCYANKNT